MYPNRFEYFAPTSLQEALSLLSIYQDEAKLLAGGQSLLSLMKLRLANPEYLIDLGHIADLNYIRQNGDKIAIGAMTTYAQIKDSELLRKDCPLLVKTASVVGDVQVRNRGTIGGSLSHADPAADMPAAVLASGAELKAVHLNGERWIKAEEFFVTTFTTALAPNEILTEIRAPTLAGHKTIYLKAAPRPTDFAIVGIAACLRLGPNNRCEGIAMGVTGASDKAYRPQALEKALQGEKLDFYTIREAAARVTEGIEVNENIHASSGFRSHLAQVYTARAIQTAMNS